MDKHEVVRILAAELAAVAEGTRLALEEVRLAIKKEIVNLEGSWQNTERKHKAAMNESKSDSWSSALLSLHEERQVKYEATRSQLNARLSELPQGAEHSGMNLDAVSQHLDVIEAAIFRYTPALAIKRRQLEFKGDYGNVEIEKWRAEIVQFVAKNPEIAQSIATLTLDCQPAGVAFDWESYVVRRVDELVDPAQYLPEPSRADGPGFEHACLASLVSAGWQGELTKASGDQGVDIIVRRGDISVAVQCKNHKIPVGNGAVQEVHAGKAFYETNFAVVVSPSGFTPSAVQLAQKLGVRLVDSSRLDTFDEILRQ